MKKHLASLVLLSFVLTSGFLCTGTQIHKMKLANADISSTLNAAAKEVIQLTTNGQMSPEEQQQILPRIYDATVLSDKMQSCSNILKTAGIIACAQPLYLAIQNDVTLSNIGLKNPTAQATFQSALGAAQVALAAFRSSGGIN